jgi:hypothetical protein
MAGATNAAVTTLRTVADLLEALPTDRRPSLAGRTTLLELSCKLQEGRPATLLHLKELGVDKLGERQKLVNHLSKVERAGQLRPFLDEATAVSSGLADGKLVPFPHAVKSSSFLANASELKARGNAAFKAGEHASAVDVYSCAADAAELAVKAAVTEACSQAEAEALLVSVHSNTAACFVKLERWPDVVTSATRALELDTANAKAMHAALMGWTDSACLRRGRVRMQRAVLVGVRGCAVWRAQVSVGSCAQGDAQQERGEALVDAGAKRPSHTCT